MRGDGGVVGFGPRLAQDFPETNRNRAGRVDPTVIEGTGRPGNPTIFSSGEIGE
jgi:hypothetical protein